MDATSSPPSATPLQSARPLWATLLSIVFHPLLVPTYIFLLLVNINPFLFGFSGMTDPRALQTFVMIFLYTFVIPMVSVLLMLALEMVGSVAMEDRMERIGPLLLVMVVYFWVYYNLSSNGMPTIFSTFLLGTVMALALAFVVNVMDKISLHAVGMGGLTATLLICTIYFSADGMHFGGVSIHLGLAVLIVTLLAGLVGTARMRLGAHTPTQVFSGYLVGVLCQVAALLFYF